MKAFWKYTVARIALFAITYAVLWMLFHLWRPVAPIDPYVGLAAILVSAVVSLFVLRGMREDFANHVHNRAALMTQRVNESRNSDLD